MPLGQHNMMTKADMNRLFHTLQFPGLRTEGPNRPNSRPREGEPKKSAQLAGVAPSSRRTITSHLKPPRKT